MTRDFIRALERELRSLAPSERNEILNEYQSHIDEALNNGESEAEILKELGDPETVAKEILLMEENETEASVPKFTVSNVPEDFNPEDISEIDINGESLKVTIVQSESFDMEFHSHSENGRFEYTVNQNVLEINHKNARDEAGFGSFFKLIKQRGSSQNDRLTIYWPVNLENLMIKTSMGSVSIEGLSAKQFNIRTDMGSIKTDNLIGVRGVFYTNMGSVKVQSGTFDSIQSESKMGSVTLTDVDANAYDLHTDMGKIDASNLNPDSNIKAKTNMGAINAHYRKMPENTRVTTKTNLGKVQNELDYSYSKNADYTAEFHTDMGAIKIKSN